MVGWRLGNVERPFELATEEKGGCRCFEQERMSQLKICVLGTAGVGKSVMTIHFISGKFEDMYDPTLEDVYTKTISIGERAFQLQILDTAGEDQYHTLRESYYRSEDGFMLVYAITEAASLAHLRTTWTALTRSRDSTTNFGCIVVGNKSDLADERVVPAADGERFADECKCDFIETSAKTGSCIREAYMQCCESILKRNPKFANTTSQHKEHKHCSLI